MNTYKKIYLQMFGDTLDIINWLEEEYIKFAHCATDREKYIIENVIEKLKKCHLNAEEIYMEYGDEEDGIKDR